MLQRNHSTFVDVAMATGSCAATDNRGDYNVRLGRHFLIVALIAALLGFGGIAGVAVEAAKIVFFVAIVLFVISLIAGLIRGRTPTVP
jgi:uncharacterized membrane protein YtjA (UPF0391 family)